MYPPPNTTPLEFGEVQDYWYDFAWELYLSAELDTISTPDFIWWAMYLDTMPGISEYFRWLLHFDLVPMAILNGAPTSAGKVLELGAAAPALPALSQQGLLPGALGVWEDYDANLYAPGAV